MMEIRRYLTLSVLLAQWCACITNCSSGPLTIIVIGPGDRQLWEPINFITPAVWLGLVGSVGFGLWLRLVWLGLRLVLALPF